MDTKKIIIGLVGGAVAGYVYYEFIAKKDVTKTITQDVEEIVDDAEGDLKSIGGGGGGGFGGGALSTDTDTKEVDSTEAITPVMNTRPASLSKEISPITKPLVKPTTSIMTKPLVKPTTSIMTKPLVKPTTISSRFSGIGGDKWEANINDLDI